MASTTKDDKDSKNAPDLGLLEEDDEFEEFPAEGKFDNKDWSGLVSAAYFFSLQIGTRKKRTKKT